jgi:hypothetical protein
MKTRALRNRLKDARDDGDSSIRWYLHYQELRELLPKATIVVFLAPTAFCSDGVDRRVWVRPRSGIPLRLVAPPFC